MQQRKRSLDQSAVIEYHTDVTQSYAICNECYYILHSRHSIAFYANNNYTEIGLLLVQGKQLPVN